MEDFKLLGWLMVVIGLAIRYAISRRKFYRRGIGGLEHFRSFEKGMIITGVEKVLSLLAFLMLWGGVLMLGYYYSLKYFEKRERERKAKETEVFNKGLKEGMLPLPHTSEQAA
ncbi:hypothetical protein [Aquiflexum lacus]|uniref:hypothetical protein n=1 Tax=Aquiflexum lacus TaxID=2483805 RepID=UPI0018949D9F|nr:hypothetical protein [Aquiflexum lacus]